MFVLRGEGSIKMQTYANKREGVVAFFYLVPSP